MIQILHSIDTQNQKPNTDFATLLPETQRLIDRMGIQRVWTKYGGTGLKPDDSVWDEYIADNALDPGNCIICIDDEVDADPDDGVKVHIDPSDVVTDEMLRREEGRMIEALTECKRKFPNSPIGWWNRPTRRSVAGRRLMSIIPHQDILFHNLYDYSWDTSDYERDKRYITDLLNLAEEFETPEHPISVIPYMSDHQPTGGIRLIPMWEYRTALEGMRDAVGKNGKRCEGMCLWTRVDHSTNPASWNLYPGDTPEIRRQRCDNHLTTMLYLAHGVLNG